MEKITNIERAKAFIEKMGIVDEDIIQELYLFALETKSTNFSSAISRKYDQLSKNNDNTVIIEIENSDYKFEDFIEDKVLIDKAVFNNKRLTQREKDVLYMYCYKEMSFSDIAHVHNRCVERIRDAYNVGLRKARYYYTVTMECRYYR